MSADRASVKRAVQQRRQQFQSWSAANRADAAALVLAQRELAAARSEAKGTRTSTQPAGLAQLIAKMSGLHQAMQANAMAIAAGRRSDFTGIKTAQQKLAADLKSLRTARQPAK